MNLELPFYTVLDDICKEKNIDSKILSFNWIIELKRGNEVHHIINSEFDLNTANSFTIANDKYATYIVLKENNIPTIEHRMIFSPYTRSTLYSDELVREAKDLLKEYPIIVLKANFSSKGDDVSRCETEEEVDEIIRKYFDEEHKDSISACPYVEIEYEYRAVVLNGEVIFIYKKRKPFVTGDGKSTVNELIIKKQEELQIEYDLFKGLDLEYVPKENEEVVVSWKHNLSSGAEPILVDDSEDRIDYIKDIAIKSAKALNISFATVDIARTKENNILVMEVNGKVCMNKFMTFFGDDGYNIAKDIYTKAIDAMFE